MTETLQKAQREYLLVLNCRVLLVKPLVQVSSGWTNLSSSWAQWDPHVHSPLTLVFHGAAPQLAALLWAGRARLGRKVAVLAGDRQG